MPTTVSVARQCLSPEATAVVDEAIAIARLRRHSQTTSLHVISALLSLPSPSFSLLRDALSRCRTFDLSNLDLCFSSALDRLPSSNASPSPGGDPPISNSLMAAIRRSQATQRRHPDTFHLYNQQQQQQNSPTLVKAELQQLVLSVLDDPVVSRVFGEGGFRSRDVKLAVLRPAPSQIQFPVGGRRPPLFLCNFSLGADDLGFPISSSPLKCDAAEENCRRIGQILGRKSGRNPLLVGVGASDAAADFKAAISAQNWSNFPPQARGLEFCSIEKDLAECVSGAREWSSTCLASRFGDLEKRIMLGVGDLKRVVDLVSEEEGGGCERRLGFFVKELSGLLESRRDKLWVTGSAATYEIYMKFLSFHPSVDKDWDLQLLPITSVKTGSIRQLKVPKSNAAVCEKNVTATEKARDDKTASYGAAGRLTTDLILGAKAGDCFICRDICGGKETKEVYKTLVEKVPWQSDAAWAISQAVAQCKEARRANLWLGFLGPDSVGKRKLVGALAESLLDSREKMISVDLSSHDVADRLRTICSSSRTVNGSELTQRGKTVIDFLTGEIRRNPRTLVFLENIDHADLPIQGSLLRAVKTGRLSDFHGREVNIGNAIFVATAGPVTREVECEFSEEDILAARTRALKILVNESERSNQKRQHGSVGKSRSSKRLVTGLLDLNLPVEEERDESSLCPERDAWMKEFLGEVNSVVFKPFDFDSVANEVVREVDRSCPCEVDIEPEAMQQILAAAWMAESRVMLTEWVRRVLVCSLIEALESRQRQVQPESCVLTLVAAEEVAIREEDRVPDILLPDRIPFA